MNFYLHLLASICLFYIWGYQDDGPCVQPISHCQWHSFYSAAVRRPARISSPRRSTACTPKTPRCAGYSGAAYLGGRGEKDAAFTGAFDEANSPPPWRDSRPRSERAQAKVRAVGRAIEARDWSQGPIKKATQTWNIGKFCIC